MEVGVTGDEARRDDAPRCVDDPFSVAFEVFGDRNDAVALDRHVGGTRR